MSAYQLPPVGQNVVDLAIADLTISAVLLPIAVWITWKHGKQGQVCWPLLISYLLSRFVDDIYQIIMRHEPLIPGALNICMQAAGICCLTLGIIGAVYEANIILPARHRRLPILGSHWPTKITMATTNLINTAGIAAATYGTSPSATGADGVQNKLVGEIGNILLLVALAAIVAWLWPTHQRIRAAQRGQHPNAAPARWLLWAAVLALPTHLVRTLYNATYAFTLFTSLDPFFGAFATKVVLLFLMQLITVLVLLAGGWKSMGLWKKDQVQLVVEGVGMGETTTEYLEARK